MSRRVRVSKRITDRDVNDRVREWTRRELEDTRNPVRTLERLLGFARAYSTCKQLWLGNARFSAADIATLAQADGFGTDFVLYVMGIEAPGFEDNVRGRISVLVEEMDALLKGRGPCPEK